MPTGSMGPPTPTAPAIRVLVAHSHLVMASWRDVVILVWRREIQPSLVERVARELGGLKSPRPIGLIVVLEPEHPFAQENERNAIGQVLSAVPLAFTAVVIESAGFKLAAVQGVTTAVSRVVNQRSPSRAFTSVPDAAAWGASLDPGMGTPEELETAVRVARSASAEP